MYGGLDWSGTPDRNNEIPLYVPCVVAVREVEKVSELFATLRREFRMKQIEEFRGSKATGEKLAAVLNAGLQLEFHVGALLIDKTASSIIPGTKAAFVTLSAKRLLNQFMPHHALHRLWCDDEDLSKSEKHRFKNDTSRMGREYGVQTLKVSIYPSHHSDLIQLADMTAYALSWDARKRSEPEVERALREIRSNPCNMVIGPARWEE